MVECDVCSQGSLNDRNLFFQHRGTKVTASLLKTEVVLKYQEEGVPNFSLVNAYLQEHGVIPILW